jgi:hypothetical protein
MSFFNKPFDTSTVEASNGFDPLPEGEYACLITKAEEKPCKNDGIQLVVEFKIIDGKHKNSNLFYRINLKNASERAAQIGAGQLSALAQACGVKVLRAAHELSNKTVRVKVKVEADSRTAGAFQNKVTSVASMTGQAAQAAAVASAPVSTEAPPWG